MKRSGLLLHGQVNRQIDSVLRHPPHALILSGPKGMGKGLLARALAAELLGNDIEAGNNPYYRELMPVKATITIEQIRNLIKFFQLQVPGRANVKRVAVIMDADMMGTEAQNALLKLLEEPPEGSVLLLTSGRLLSLLPTIRSRAQSLVLPEPEQAAITQYFTTDNIDSEVVRRAVMRHGANIAAITQTLREEPVEADTVLDMVKRALTGTTFDRLLLVDSLAKQKDQVILFVDTLATVAVSGLNTAAAKTNPVARWQNILQSANIAQEALDRNGNPKLILTELMLSL